MGMIVIDIEMPERCGKCPCFHAEYPMHCQLIKPPDKNKRLAAPYGLPRPDWCPLKGQEPMPMLEVEDDDLYAWSPEDINYYCPRPECGKEIFYDYNFCPYCGQAVKLNEID